MHELLSIERNKTIIGRAFPQANFAVLSDIHYYDSNLGTEGKAFGDLFENKEIKMLAYSREIVQSAVKTLNLENIDFIIISGDLTKDGELSSHKELVQQLSPLLESGKKIYVINGNHDVLNSRASSYFGDTVEKTDNITPHEFAQIYADFGYNGAIARDPNSLSYVAEPVPGLWLVAMDSCRWRKGFREDGRFSRQTLAWIENMLYVAGKENKAVLGVMHHGLLEHYRGNKKYYGNFIIKNNEKIGKLFTRLGLRIVFTGHFHAQDIAFKSWGNPNNYLYDIETGSLATYPCPYRLVTINSNQTLTIKSKRIETIDRCPGNFQEFAYRYCYSSVEKSLRKNFRRWNLSDRDIDSLVPQVADAFTAHGTGNQFAREQALSLKGVSLWGKVVMQSKKRLIEGLWETNSPPDNQITIDLTTGKYY